MDCKIKLLESEVPKSINVKCFKKRYEKQWMCLLYQTPNCIRKSGLKL